MKKLVILISLLMLVLTGCASNEKSKETSLKTEETKEDVVVGMTWIVSSLDPTNSSNPWALTTHGISEYVYMLDKDGNSTSRFIDKLEQVDDLTWKGTLKEGVKFSDGSDVDSEAFVKSMNTIQEKNELSNASCGKMEFTSVDKTSFEVKTSDMRSAVDRVSLVLREGEYNVVRMKIESSQIVITARNLDVGDSTEAVSAKVEGQEMDLGFNVRYLMDILKNMESESFTGSTNGPLTPLLIKPVGEEGYLYIVTPVRK